LITCCAADATPIGVTVEADDAAKYPDNTWIAVDATLSMRDIQDADTIPPISWYYGSEKKPALIAHSIQRIDEPQDPYLIQQGVLSGTGGQ
jgi:putative membrane protein